jgi:hypothetical protein
MLLWYVCFFVDRLPYVPSLGARAECVFVKVKVTLRPTISRPVRLGVRRPSGTRDQFFFLVEISFRQLLFVIL